MYNHDESKEHSICINTNIGEYVADENKNYIEYYNKYRYQWGLKKMTPVNYRNHLIASLA